MKNDKELTIQKSFPLRLCDHSKYNVNRLMVLVILCGSARNLVFELLMMHTN